MKKYIISTLMLVTCHLHATTLILTRGPVSSRMGTYLLNAVTAYNNSYASISHIDATNVAYTKLLNDFFPYDMNILRRAMAENNISYAITNYHTYFKDTAYPEQKADAIERIEQLRAILNDPRNERVKSSLGSVVKHMVMMNVAYEAACNNSVILEGGTLFNIDDEANLLANSFDTIIKVFTYVHPTDMINEWKKRNEAAIVHKQADERRLIKHVLTSFFNSFKSVDTADEAIVTLTRDEFDTIVEQAAEYIATVPAEEFGENGLFTRSEFTLHELDEFKDTVYNKLGFNTQDIVYLVPALAYDLVLTSAEECLDFAQNLVLINAL